MRKYVLLASLVLAVIVVRLVHGTPGLALAVGIMAVCDGILAVWLITDLTRRQR